MFTSKEYPPEFVTGVENVGMSAARREEPVTEPTPVKYPDRIVEVVIVAGEAGANPVTVSSKFEPDAVPLVNVPALTFGAKLYAAL